jgi:antitoxin (DNA-binding transcriptional repressor) of toxin-antitoxin stability system
MRNMNKRTATSTSYVSATEAAKNFGAIVHRVREARAEYTVERGGVPVARIVPVFTQGGTVADLVALLRAVVPGDKAFGEAVRDGVRGLNAPRVPHDPWAS